MERQSRDEQQEHLTAKPIPEIDDPDRRDERPTMTPQTLLTACCFAIAGAGLYFSPDALAARIRGAVTDALRPGQQAVRFAKMSAHRGLATLIGSTTTADEVEVARLTQDLETEQIRSRALETRLAQLTEQHLPENGISPAMKRSQRLLLPTLIEVAVLGDLVAEQWRAGKLLDEGSKGGLRENELVLSSRKPLKPLIDLGEDADISSEDTLLLGRCVIGKVEHVGRWTSSFQPVTDARYRGRAQLIRETSEGFVFETQGILKGQGSSLCKLTGIPAEKSVHLHDSVYTADRDGLQATPLYYGEVTEATLGTDDREWNVVVKPVPLPSHLTTVQVLRLAVNPERLVVK
jgi:cell shape-determining protein MreC